MFQKFFVISSSLLLLLTVFPKNTFALAAPAATSCNNTGGNYELIYEGVLPRSGVCRYLFGVQCTDYQFYQTNECAAMVLFFGSLNSWPTSIIYLLVFFLFIKWLQKRMKMLFLMLI